MHSSQIDIQDMLSTCRSNRKSTENQLLFIAVKSSCNCNKPDRYGANR